MFVDSGGFANAYQGGIRQGGAFELKQVTWAFNAALEAPEIRNDPAKRAALQAIDIKAWFGRMPWSRGHSPLSLVPEYESYVFDQWEHGRLRRLLEASRDLRRRLIRSVQRRADRVDVVVVRPVPAHRDRQLRRARAPQAQSAASDPRALDSRQQPPRRLPATSTSGRRRSSPATSRPIF